MPRPHRITCETCHGTGAINEQPCFVCGGLAEFDWGAIFNLAMRAESLVNRTLKLNREIRRLSRGDAKTKRIVADYMRGMEQKMRA